MPPSEKRACVRLLKNESNSKPRWDSDDSTTSLLSLVKMQTSISYKAWDLEKSAYICCDFIGVSEEIVEQIWSKEDALKTKRRK